MRRDLRSQTRTRRGPAPLRIPPKSILSFVDFSPASLEGARLAAELAQRWGTALELVHVAASIPPVLSENADSPADRDGRKRYFRSLEARLKDAVDCRRTAQAAVIEGDPKEVLRGLASERAESLIVLGARAQGDLEQRLFGSTVGAVVAAAQVPVLTVRGPIAPRWPGRLLVLMGEEEYHDRALVYGLALAHKLHAAVSVAHLAERAQDKTAAAETLQARLRRLGLGHDRRLNERISCAGSGGDCLAERGRAGDIGLLVLATRRDRPWEPAVLGPAAEAAIDGCAVPVLTVPGDGVSTIDELLGALSSGRSGTKRCKASMAGSEP